ncbi:50S ribosomal protein L29 [Candidatus Peregrinibacteria bacterium CG10_big_fil_rev_8_21_14_0_10_49_24]|nr:MAG: 50S ribosomal protein L29 [Candidatus Peregrinibacteria bacterium CG11_big_fil_rev_8_21_14_0_20_49_14]PIR50363.1 MAG: 50S ribosomal protein L29 [Candidatus Peregrinibacteria bacterium CG10_big_fil_rev_8_21_14_0_10_49_24]
MAKLVSIIELRKMQPADLRKEIREQEVAVTKLRLGVELRKEKDSAKYKREKVQLARMKTVLTEKQTEQLLKASTEPTVAAPKKK